MAQRYRRSSQSPATRIPELLVSGAGALTAFTGVWLWWFGEATVQRPGSLNRLSDPYAVQEWIHRLHWGGAYGLAALLALMLIRAVVRQDRWRVLIALMALALIVVGFWAGYTADWEGARLWASTVGTKLTAGLRFGDAPALPDSLQRARLHLSIVPAGLLMVALVSALYYRRS